MRQLFHEEIEKKHHNLSIVVICDELQSPANLGSIFRSAEAFGVKTIFIQIGNEKFLKQPRFIKTARHSFNHINVEIYSDIDSLLKSLKQEDFQILALEKCDASIRLQDIKFSQKISIIVGHEKSGVNRRFLEKSDLTGHIEMFGQNSSMNASQALNIGLYECIRQQV